jgi:hypothetical protein
MLEALVPLAAALTNNTAAKPRVEPNYNSNPNAAHAKEFTQPQTRRDPFSVDGSTVP